MDNASSRLENDRHRYNQLINIRRKQAKNKTNNWLQATEIIERAQEANTMYFQLDLHIKRNSNQNV